MRNFTVKFLLFALFNTTVFSMQQKSLYPTTAVFHPTEKQIALFYPDQSIKIWDTTSNYINDVKDISLDTIKAAFAIEKCEPNILAHNSLKIFKNKSIIVGYKENAIFTSETFLKDIIKSCALNAHNTKHPIIAIGFEKETHVYNKINTAGCFNVLQKNNSSYSLQYEDGIHSTALAFNADGTQLVSCTNDGKAALYVWEDNKLTPLNNAVISINPPLEIKKPVEIEVEKIPALIPIIEPIIAPQEKRLFNQIVFNPLCALKALYHNTSFTTKTFTAFAGLAGLSAIWFYYTKYLTSQA